MGPRVGILLGRDRARAVLVRPGRRGAPARVLASAEAPLDPAAWSGAPHRVGPALAALARGLPSEARRVDRPLALALPDPVATEDRLTFRELPGTPAELAQLVRFRIARDHRREAGEIACAAQPAGPVAGGTEVLVRVMTRAVLTAVEEGAHRAGFVPRRIDTWSGFALDRAAEGRRSGALLWSDGGWWSLMCWSRGGPRVELPALQEPTGSPPPDAGTPVARAEAGRDGDAGRGPERNGDEEAVEAPGSAGPRRIAPAEPEDGPPRDETHLHAEWRHEGDSAALADKAVRIAKSFALRCGLPRLPMALDLNERRAVVERIEGDPIMVPGPAWRPSDPASCVALA